MSNKDRKVVFSTEPDPAAETKAPVPKAHNLAAPIPSRQLNNPVRVYIERSGRGGKIVSVIKGVMSPPQGKEALLKLLKQKLGTGGTLKEEHLEIQGDQREKIVAILNELGYKAKSAGG